MDDQFSDSQFTGLCLWEKLEKWREKKESALDREHVSADEPLTPEEKTFRKPAGVAWILTVHAVGMGTWFLLACQP